jgi:hypothetical protein
MGVYHRSGTAFRKIYNSRHREIEDIEGEGVEMQDKYDPENKMDEVSLDVIDLRNLLRGAFFSSLSFFHYAMYYV